MIFPLFYWYSSISMATPSMFGKAHTILKTAHIITNSETIHLCFCHFPYFIDFSFSIATPSIFGNACRILKAAPQTSYNEHHLPLFLQFFLLLLLFLLSIAMLSILGNPYCTVKALPNIITNSEYHPLFFALKLPIFYSNFSFAKAPFSRFGSAHGPWKHPTALPKWLQQVQRNNKFFCWN